MNKAKTIGILFWATFFGIAMAVREYANTIWLRAIIASVGGVGLGIAIVLAQRNH